MFIFLACKGYEEYDLASRRIRMTAHATQQALIRGLDIITAMYTDKVDVISYGFTINKL
jgi:hypothetical protein